MDNEAENFKKAGWTKVMYLPVLINLNLIKNKDLRMLLKKFRYLKKLVNLIRRNFLFHFENRGNKKV